MSHLELFLLGPPRIECNGEPIEIDRRKAMALLVYLAVTGQNHSRDALAALLWPEHDQSQARAGLRRALATLKKALRQAQDAALGKGWLDVDRETVGLNPDAEVWLDVDEFRDRLAECQAHGHPPEEVCPACLPPLAEATALYRDDFLVGFTLRDSPGFDEWQFFQTEGLRNALASALERLTHGYSNRGEFERAIACARRWLTLDPLHESAHRHLMQLYAWSGQRAAALRQYRECERVLKEELGMPPEEETTQIHEAIKKSRGLPLPVDRFATPVLPQTAARKHNLPIQPTPFVGREAELAELARLLADPDIRLVTILGAGGMGKTRLALEAAAAQMDNFAHGVFFVPLAPLHSVETIVSTVAEALGFSFYGEDEPQQQLLDYLCQKTMLLIMDSFEHLLACPERRPELVEGPSRRDGVGVVTEVLKTAPEVKILVTSRARLNVQGEHLFPIAGMDFPDREIREDAIQYSAVKLFVQSARWVQPGFELTADNLTDVIHVCHLVQGMPLGILLAAAWVGMLTPAEIAAEIGQSLDFLETDLRDVPERQRSIRAVFDHSWNLLTEREREVFQGLSVFRGGFTRQAAQQVTGASLRELMALVSKSLLHHMPTPSASLGTGGRYEIHELLREYAAEKLDQSPAASQAVHDRHGAYYAAALQQREDDLRGPWQQTGLVETADAEIEADIENTRAAWDWAVERGQVEKLEQAMEGLCRFYDLHWRYQEGEAACRMAAEKLAATASGDGPVTSTGSVRGLSPEPSRRVEGLRVLARILTWQGNFNRRLGHAELASQLLRQSLALLEGPELANQDTRSEKAFILLQMGHIASNSDRKEARRLYKQSLALYQALGDQRGAAYVMRTLSGIAVTLDASGEGRQLLGRFAEAHSLLEESVAIYNDLGFRDSIASTNISLGSAKMHLGQYEPAGAQGQIGLALSREIGYRRGIGYACWLLGCVALAEEAYAQARQWLQESVAVYQEIGQREDLGEALATLGYAARGLGNLLEAQQRLYEALQTATEIEAFVLLMLALPAIALHLADQGEKERAVELYALASRYPFLANSRWFKDVAGRQIAAAAATLLPEVVAAAQERGRARDLEATVAELLVELGG